MSLMILSYVVKCSWCWMVGKEEISLNLLLRVEPLLLVKLQSCLFIPCISFSFFFFNKAQITIDPFPDAFPFSRFACFACLNAKKKKKTVWKKWGKINEECFWLWQVRTQWFLNVRKAIVLLKLSTAFPNCQTKAAQQVAHFIPKKKRTLVKDLHYLFFFQIWVLL